ncbi:hypothetical protein [Croceimicrobium sp.]|uniref:hypothetical protein n=1 Tax=Croceimicrobium sp. TaxID=2828340 RepID=UPI003BAA877F
MRKALFSLILSLSALYLSAQSQITKSQIFKTEDSGFAPKILHEDETKFYCANVTHDMIRVVIFDKKSLNKESQFDVNIRQRTGVEYGLLNLAWIDGKIMAFIREDNSSRNVLMVMAYPINVETRRLEKAVQLTARKYEYRSDRGVDKLSLIGDRIVVQSAAYNGDLDKTEKRLNVFDHQLQELCAYDYQMQLELEELNTDVAFDKDGNIYLQNNRELLVLEKANAYQAKSYPLPMVEKEQLIPFSYQLANNPKGEVVLTAFYQRADEDEDLYPELERISEVYEEIATEGLLYYVFDPASQSFSLQRRHKFEQSFVDKFLESGDAGEEPFIPQVFTKIVLHFDAAGNCYLIGERLIYRPFYSTSLATMGTLMGEQFDLEDLILLKISPSGDIDWKNNIAKMHSYMWQRNDLIAMTSSDQELSIQPMGEFDFFSFYSRLSDGKLEIIYNDIPENEIGQVSYEDVEVFDEFDDGFPNYLVFNPGNGQEEKLEIWEDMILENDLYFKTQSIYYSEKEQSYFGFLGEEGEYQLIKFAP